MSRGKITKQELAPDLADKVDEITANASRLSAVEDTVTNLNTVGVVNGTGGLDGKRYALVVDTDGLYLDELND